MAEREPLLRQTEVASTRAQLVALLRGRMDAMVRPWLENRMGRHDAVRLEADHQAVRGVLEAVLDQIEEAGARGGVRDRLNAFLLYRRGQGIDLGALFDEVGRLRQSAWTALAPELARGSLDPQQAGLLLNQAFDHTLEALVRGLHQREILNLRQAASTDSLTGLSNHRHFYQQLQEEIKRASRLGYRVSVLLIDVDHFKRFNDENGHQAGDHALRQLAEVLVTQRRSTDTSARYGGDEFAMILPGAQKRDVFAVAENLAHRFQLGSGLTFSAGIANYPEDGETPTLLVEAADRALYQAKGQGRDRTLSA